MHRVRGFDLQCREAVALRVIGQVRDLARGDFHEGSDVDLIVVGDFPERHHKRAAAILDLTDLPIEPLCYTGEEFAGMVRSGNPSSAGPSPKASGYNSRAGGLPAHEALEVLVRLERRLRPVAGGDDDLLGLDAGRVPGRKDPRDVRMAVLVDDDLPPLVQRHQARKELRVRRKPDREEKPLDIEGLLLPGIPVPNRDPGESRVPVKLRHFVVEIGPHPRLLRPKDVDLVAPERSPGDQGHGTCDLRHFDSGLEGRVSAADDGDRFIVEERSVAGRTDGNAPPHQPGLSREAQGPGLFPGSKDERPAAIDGIRDRPDDEGLILLLDALDTVKLKVDVVSTDLVLEFFKEVRPRDRREPHVVLDRPAPGRLPADVLRYNDGLHEFPGAVDRSRQPGRSGARDHHIADLLRLRRPENFPESLRIEPDDHHIAKDRDRHPPLPRNPDHLPGRFPILPDIDGLVGNPILPEERLDHPTVWAVLCRVDRYTCHR